MTVESTPGDEAPPSIAETPARPRFGSSFLVASGIFISRIFGLVRERVFAHYFGSSESLGAFRAAYRIPNTLQNLLGEGVLSASFIPVYSRLLAEKDEKTAGRVAGFVLSILATAVSIIVVIGTLAAPLLVDIIAPGFEGEIRALTIRIVRILFPAIGLLVLAAWCLGILNSHRKFFVPYVAPVLWNAAMIVTLMIFGSRLERPQLAIALAWGMVVGCLLQLLIQIPFVLRHAREIRFGFDTTLEPVRKVFRNVGPVVVGRGVVQMSAILDEVIGSLIGPIAIASIGYAQTIYTLPISLFGMSVAAAELPEMSRAVGTVDEIHAALRKRIQAGKRQVLFFVAPTVVAFFAIGNLLVGALYQTGDFAEKDTYYVWYILAGSTVGIVAATLARLYSSAFYALHDTKTPLRYAIVHVLVAGVLGLLLAFPLRPLIVSLIDLLGMPTSKIPGGEVSLGAVGLTLGAALGMWAEYLLLRRALDRRVGDTRLDAGFLTRVWGAALLGAVAGLLVAHLLVPRVDILSHPIPAALVAAGSFGLVYLATTAAFGIPEVQRIVRRFV